MAATKFRNSIPYKEYTHTLSIRLGTSSFLSQFQTSFQPFRNNASAIIPEKAFLVPELYRLNIGKLRLNTAQRLQEFLKVMHGLDYCKLLGPAPAIAQSPITAVEQFDTARSVAHIAPLKIDVSGLTTESTNPSRATHLYLLLVDPTYRLQLFLQSLRDCFSAAGFPLLKTSEKQRVKVIDARMVHWHTYIVLPNGERRYYKREARPIFDMRELLKVYKNTIWAKEVPLERISLDGIGIRERTSEGDTVFTPPREVDSVALP